MTEATSTVEDTVAGGRAGRAKPPWAGRAGQRAIVQPLRLLPAWRPATDRQGPHPPGPALAQRPGQWGISLLLAQFGGRGTALEPLRLRLRLRAGSSPSPLTSPHSRSQGTGLRDTRLPRLPRFSASSRCLPVAPGASDSPAGLSRANTWGRCGWMLGPPASPMWTHWGNSPWGQLSTAVANAATHPPSQGCGPGSGRGL